jgi:protein-L-isoaspartate(D-aspartate) O-methyltransferase
VDKLSSDAKNRYCPAMARGLLRTLARLVRRVRLVTSATAVAAACTRPPTPPASAPEGDEATTAIAGDDALHADARRNMVDVQIRRRGIQNGAVLAAMERVPRHLFVPPDARHLAYSDSPLAIGEGQTISQPYIVAYMTAALEVSREDTVLEIGTGSGYQAAVLAELARLVHTIEIVPALADQARRALAEAGYTNIDVRTGDGYRGWPERAPFSRIIVTAAPPQIPPALVEQLAVGGRMVLPVGTGDQEIVIVTKTADGVATTRTIPVRFVPMVEGRAAADK